MLKQEKYPPNIMSYLTTSLKQCTCSLTLQHLINSGEKVLQLGYECFLDVDFDDNSNSKVPTMLDLIKAYSEEKSKRQDKIEPITAIEREDYG
jgi:hypothetical protein